MSTRLLLLVGFFMPLKPAEQQKCYIEFCDNLDYEPVVIPAVLYEHRELLDHINMLTEYECLQELCAAINNGQQCIIYKHLAGGMQAIDTALTTTKAHELVAFKEQFAIAQYLVEQKDSSIFAKPDAVTRTGNNPKTVTTNAS